MVSFLIIIILSYLVGSFPTAIMAGKLILKDDIRNHGSGNAGATNVYRVMGWKPALVVVLIDIGKGVVATLLISKIGTNPVSLDITLIRIAAGASAIIGHVWTIFAGFKGGKGVGTAFGVLLALAPIASAASGVIWIILVFTTRIVSIGSISAGILFPIMLIIEKKLLNKHISDSLIIMGILIALLIIVTHRSNIFRLIKGEENRFGSR